MAAAVRGRIFIVWALLLVSGLFAKTFGEVGRYSCLSDIIRGNWNATVSRTRSISGLGFIENKFGLIYDEDFGYERARKSRISLSFHPSISG